MNKTLILLYHNIVSAKDLCLYDVDLINFKEQAEYLCSIKESLPFNVILSFDDGYKSWGDEVLRALRELNLGAYFFICVKNIEENKIAKEDILRLRQEGMIIGSHSLTHKYLSLLSKKEICYELEQSKHVLEGIIGESIDSLSIPGGLYDDRVISIAKGAGYKRIFTSDIGINNGEFTQLENWLIPGFVLKRVPVTRKTTLDDFKNILEGRNIKKMAVVKMFKDKGKEILGMNTYNWIRRLLVKRAE